MFGIVEQPCGLQQEWTSHLCGLCLTLRDRHGQAARVTTNRDAVVLSALYEAQAGQSGRTRAAPCPLRGFRRADVVESSGLGVRFASAIALLLAAVAVDDKLADAELGPAVIGKPAARLADRWRRDALRETAAVGFDGAAILEIVGQQGALEATPGLAFAAYAAPTERSVGAVFRHTAVLAGSAHNADGLEGVGRMFGRVAYLLDAWEDRESDRRHSRFNALDAATPQEDGHELFRVAHGELRGRLDGVDFRQPELVRSLLVDGLHRTGRRILAGDRRPRPRSADDSRPPRWVTGLLAGCAAAVGSCGVCTVCVRSLSDACKCHDCDCSGCDCSGCDCSGCDCNC